MEINRNYGLEAVCFYNTLLGKEGFRRGEREEVGWAEQRVVPGGRGGGGGGRELGRL